MTDVSRTARRTVGPGGALSVPRRKIDERAEASGLDGSGPWVRPAGERRRLTADWLTGWATCVDADAAVAADDDDVAAVS